MKVNIPGSPPRNTEGAKRQVAPNVPVLWGPLTISSPLHLPYVCRFLYAYAPEDTPPELTWSGCGCPDGDCEGRTCDWVLQFKREWIGGIVGPDFVPNHYTRRDLPPGFKDFPISPGPTAASVYKESYETETESITNGYVKITPTSDPTDIIYFGLALSAPDNLITKIYSYHSYWKRICDVDIDDGCLNYYYTAYSIFNNRQSVSPSCVVPGVVGRVILEAITEPEISSMITSTFFVDPRT